MSNELFQLITIDNQLCLYKGEIKNKPKKSNYITVDYLSNEWIHRLKGGVRELLSKALGVSKGHKSVLDLTCGLGQDAFLISRMGLKLTAIEKSQALYELVQDALDRYESQDGVKAFELLNSDSLEYLQNAPKVDVIYLDPMFPEKKKSSLPSKEMQFLQEYLGEAGLSEGLLLKALKMNCKRVVVKRHLRSDYLDDIKPDFQVKGKAVRYDVYSINKK